MMGNRWNRYILLGYVFGVLDWYFLSLLSFLGEEFSTQIENASGVWQVIAIVLIVGLNFGIWLAPVIPAAIYEFRQSESIWNGARAAVAVWGSAIFSYYLYYTGLLMFWGLPNMEHMLYSNNGAANYWQDWTLTFRRVILDQFIDWIGIAIIGGGIVGAITALVYKGMVARRSLLALEKPA